METLTTTTTFSLDQFLEHLLSHTTRLTVPAKGAEIEWDDRALHQAAYEHNPRLYALTALAPAINEWQRAKILLQVLATSQKELTDETRQLLARVVNVGLAALPGEIVLKLFLALRRTRANHKHTSRAILAYMFSQPELVGQHRAVVADCLEHALGLNVARATARYLVEPDGDAARQRYIERALRLAQPDTRQEVRQWLPYLFGRATLAQGQALVPAEAAGATKTSRQELLTHLLDQPIERPKTVTATNRGDIAATLVHLYRGGAVAELETALTDYTRRAAGQLPHYTGRVALVLDVSASMRGYGDREYAVLAQSVALQRVLSEAWPGLRVYRAGGSGDLSLPLPGGPTDLATALLDALEGQPELVIVVSDGYENYYQGDLARLTASLGNLGLATPVVFCHSKFTGLDDLSLRRPALALKQLEFWHEADFEELLLRLLTLVGPGGETALDQFLTEKLSRAEQLLAG